MHNSTKIKLFRTLLYISYPIALLTLYPFILFKKKNKSELFFFFDRYVIGGAQRVHLDILAVLKKIPKQVYFTRYSPNDKMKQEFYTLENCACKDIHFWCDNLLIRLLTVHYYAFYINRHKKPLVFSSNSTFFYDMLPFIKRSSYNIELLHNFTYGNDGMEFFGLANYMYLNKRLTVDAATQQNIINQYTTHSIPAEYNSRVLLIEPGVTIDQNNHAHKTFNKPYKILYAGRGGAQKRIPLLDKVATALIKQEAPVEFHFAGTMADELSEFVIQHSVMHGEISDPKKMQELYKTCHMILMTSAYEGFPMLIKEGMINGCVPVVTALDGNKMHLKHNENALLIDNFQDEEYVVATAIQLISEVCNGGYDIQQLSETAYQYAHQNFNKERFNEKYKILFKEILEH